MWNCRGRQRNTTEARYKAERTQIIVVCIGIACDGMNGEVWLNKVKHEVMGTRQCLIVMGMGGDGG